MTDIAVIGAGQAGASLVAKLRSEGFSGTITMFGGEIAPPYQRPPLSKKYLLGEMDEARLYLRPESWYAENGIDLRLGAPVEAIAPAAREIIVGGEVVRYDQLALTTGSVPRHLPAALGGNLAGVYAVRSLADVDAMAPEFQQGARVLIVGGGYIGLEAAAVASKLGLQVTLIEMADRILQRVACPETSRYFRDLHLSRGVDLREGTGLERLTGAGRVSGAVLGDGTELEVDFVIVGMGILPDEILAEEAGLEIENGIRCDSHGRTSDPHIWSAGDCASFPWQGGRLRLESVQNAIDMAEAVAVNMLGGAKPYVPKPWFWSDQYEVKLQIAGLNTGYDNVVARLGDKGAVSHWYFAGDRLLAVDAMNDPRGYMVGKRLIEAGKTADPVKLADPATDLKELMKG
ncbi:NAD(P)/FAD-dependent oxidoreductase [Pseudooceanicola algae]|uniref:Dicamba O-demethylase 1, ferredoxin reductase component n=1 Tax=Pseudooceanicola algae TaxID=1537215 RepID=A0A418SGN9_9RHOB|nr:FAD-dependent oxidoreductase [Pseudooceanicola algae]QPM91799.1 Dicamba O-demethylase 1, ferredoxin reductase component [Pseudooceanicola algae]